MSEPTTSLPVLPLKNTVLFPYLLMPLSLGRAGSQAALEAALATEDKALIAVAQRDATVEEPTEKDLFTVGTRAVVKKMARGQGTIELIVQGLERLMRHKIASQAQTEMTREQREYLLRQQLRAIQEELGESEPEQAEVVSSPVA